MSWDIGGLFEGWLNRGERAKSRTCSNPGLRNCSGQFIGPTSKVSGSKNVVIWSLVYMILLFEKGRDQYKDNENKNKDFL